MFVLTYQPRNVLPKIQATFLHSASQLIVNTVMKQRNTVKQFSPYLTLPLHKWGRQRKDGLTVLRTNEHGAVSLAVGRIPELDRSIITGPKGFTGTVAAGPSQLIFDEQRLLHMKEFYNAMLDPKSDMGVLFSGPNGVGKSGICFATFLLCFAQSLPTLYIPMADSWVDSCDTKEAAHRYFMQEFFAQNADLIVLNERYASLRPFFVDQIEGHVIGRDAYINFARAVRKGLLGPIGVIVDEVQKITEAAEDSTELTIRTTGHDKRFFAKHFTKWTGNFGGFRSQLCASSHGLKEFNLPSGEESRRRFVYPMEPNDVQTLLQTPDNPLYNPILKPYSDKIGRYAGGCIRDVHWFVNGFPSDLSSDKISDRIQLVKSNLVELKYDKILKSWWKKVPDTPSAHRNLLSHLLSVFRGREIFSSACKNLYDYGLITLVRDSNIVRPISEIAMIALNKFYSEHYKDSVLSVKEVMRMYTAAEAGYNFQDQIDSLLPFLTPPFAVNAVRLKDLAKEGTKERKKKTSGTTKKQNDKKILPVRLDVVVMKPFDSRKLDSAALLQLIEPDEHMRVLWSPNRVNEVVDGIIMPCRNSTEPIVVYDASVTNPLESKRRKKALVMKDAMELLKQKFQCNVIGVMFWHLPYIEAGPSEEALDDLPDDVYLIDGNECLRIGIKINESKV